MVAPFPWLRIASAAERDFKTLAKEPLGPESAALWKEVRVRLERAKNSRRPELGIFPEMMGMVTYYLRNDPRIKGRVRNVWMRVERELLRSRPPVNSPIVPYKP